MLSTKLIEELKDYVADKGRGWRVDRKLAKIWPQESGGGAGRKFEVAAKKPDGLEALKLEEPALEDFDEALVAGSAPDATPADSPREAYRACSCYGMPAAGAPTAGAPAAKADKSNTKSKLEQYIEQRRKPAFSTHLMALIDRKGLVDSEVYKKAGIDRRHFSKMRSSAYHPSKNTVLALCLALELNLDEAKDLLGSAGYTLSSSDLADLVLSFCFERRIFNLMDVNQALAAFDLKPLGVLA